MTSKGLVSPQNRSVAGIIDLEEGVFFLPLVVSQKFPDEKYKKFDLNAIYLVFVWEKDLPVVVIVLKYFDRRFFGE